MGAFNTFRLLQQSRRNQWLKITELDKLQVKRLRAIVRHAYDNVLFYHDKFRAAGIQPNNIRNWESYYRQFQG